MSLLLINNGLYEISRRLLATTKVAFAKVEAHEADDPDGSDHFWLFIEESETSEGELIGLSPLSGGSWCAYHDLAHKFGGRPTVWSFYGTEAEVLKAIESYLDELIEEGSI